MLTWKSILYLFTLAAAFIFAFCELRLKRQLSDKATKTRKNLSDFGVLSDLSERIERERILESQPTEALKALRVIAGLKLVFVGIFIIEVIVFQG